MSAPLLLDTSGHALGSAADLARAGALSQQGRLPRSQQQQRLSGQPPVQQQGPAAPCCATSQAVPVAAAPAAAGGVRAAGHCGQIVRVPRKVDHKFQQNGMKRTPSIV
jgi:hypothetical protein